MAFAAFTIFFIIAGILALQLVQLQPIPVDAISFTFVLWNFSVSLEDVLAQLVEKHRI